MTNRTARHFQVRKIIAGLDVGLRQSSTQGFLECGDHRLFIVGLVAAQRLDLGRHQQDLPHRLLYYFALGHRTPDVNMMRDLFSY